MGKKRKRGRPPVELTDEQRKALINVIAAGTSRRRACALIGISYETFRKWMTRAKKASRGKYRALLADVKKAESLFIAKTTNEIHKAGMPDGERPGQWTALAWLLERRFPDEFGRRDRATVKVTGDGKAPTDDPREILGLLSAFLAREKPPARREGETGGETAGGAAVDPVPGSPG
jgi:transposase